MELCGSTEILDIPSIKASSIISRKNYSLCCSFVLQASHQVGSRIISKGTVISKDRVFLFICFVLNIIPNV